MKSIKYYMGIVFAICFVSASSFDASANLTRAEMEKELLETFAQDKATAGKNLEHFIGRATPTATDSDIGIEDDAPSKCGLCLKRCKAGLQKAFDFLKKAKPWLDTLADGAIAISGAVAQAQGNEELKKQLEEVRKRKDQVSDIADKVINTGAWLTQMTGYVASIVETVPGEEFKGAVFSYILNMFKAAQSVDTDTDVVLDPATMTVNVRFAPQLQPSIIIGDQAKFTGISSAEASLDGYSIWEKAIVQRWTSAVRQAKIPGVSAFDLNLLTSGIELFGKFGEVVLDENAGRVFVYARGQRHQLLSPLMTFAFPEFGRAYTAPDIADIKQQQAAAHATSTSDVQPHVDEH